jgi:hypothetical protein
MMNNIFSMRRYCIKMSSATNECQNGFCIQGPYNNGVYLPVPTYSFVHCLENGEDQAKEYHFVSSISQTSTLVITQTFPTIKR